jgi:uncharacterized protein YycO
VGFISHKPFYLQQEESYMKTSEIMKGDLLFVGGTGIIQFLIQLITRSRFSHVAIFVDSETLVEAKSGRKTGTTLLSTYLNSKNKLVVFRDTSLNEKEREQIAKYALDHQGIEYNYMAILAELARYELGLSLKYYDEGNKRICSSFVNDCGKSVDRQWTTEKVPSPKDLIKGKQLTKIGKLKKK